MLAYAFQKVYTFADNYQSTKEHEKIVAFNTQYTKYATNTGNGATYIYSEDIVTLTEQVLNWNKITANDNEKIELHILDKSGGIIYSTQKESIKFERETFLDTYKLRGDPTQALVKEYKFSCSVELDSGSYNRKERYEKSNYHTSYHSNYNNSTINVINKQISSTKK